MAKNERRVLIDIDEAKRWLRRALIRDRQSLSPLERRRRSRALCAALIDSPVFRRARTLALFLSFGSEADTAPLIEAARRAGKKVVLPVTAHGFDRPYFALFRPGDTLQKTPFGPLEFVERKTPFPFRDIDLVATPGLAFDRFGHRLGYGGGVYDRVLAQTPRAVHVGVFFSTQEVFRVPVGRHDRPLGFAATDRGLRRLNFR